MAGQADLVKFGSSHLNPISLHCALIGNCLLSSAKSCMEQDKPHNDDDDWHTAVKTRSARNQFLHLLTSVLNSQ